MKKWLNICSVAMAAALAGAAQAQQFNQPLSSALGIQAKLQVEGISTQVGPIDQLVGQTSGAYNSSETVARVNESTALVAQPVTPTIFVRAKNIVSHIAASGIQIDSRTSRGDSQIDSADIWINLNPPPPTGPFPQPYLSITLHNLDASANYSLVLPKTSAIVGNTSLGSLSVSGQFVGDATLKYAGSAAPNTLIFDTPTITITLNRQMKTGIISCSPNCTFTPTSLDVSAVYIELHKAIMGNHKISGTIAIGENSAQ